MSLSLSRYRKVGKAFKTDLRAINTFYSTAGNGTGSHFWVAEASDPLTGTKRIVGTVGLQRIDADVAELRRLAVCLSTRGARVGSTLVRNLIQHAKDSGFKTVILSTASANFSALGLYAKLGWRLIRVVDEPVRRMHYLELDLGTV